MNNFILLNNYKSYKFHSTFNEIEKIDKTDNSIYTIKFALLIILILYFSFYNPNKLYLKTFEQNAFNYEMKNYSLYNLSRYPQISILLYNIEEKEQLLNFSNTIFSQTLKDIQIIYLWKNKREKQNYNIIKNISLFDERIIIVEYQEKTNIEENIYFLMNKIKGKFTFIIDKIFNFCENQLESFYNATKGKINNIFEFSVENIILYLIKTKILFDLLDDGKFFSSFQELVNNIKLMPLPNLNYISISFCPNNIYTPLTYVSMISILKTKSFNTYISFYLIIPNSFKSSNENFIFSLYDQFDLFNITFIKMDNRYKNVFVSRRMSQQTYYRFSLGELLPNLNKIIYLDSDVIVYKDLSSLYNLNFNGKFVLGQVTGNNKNKKTGVYRINNGILIFNLYNMRKFQIEQKALNIIKQGKHFFYHDQTLMNNYFKNYIGIFQIEYHIRNWNNISTILHFNKGSGKVYDDDIFYFASKYPSIRHFLGSSKPISSEVGHIEDWWFFARQSKFFVTKYKINIKPIISAIIPVYNCENSINASVSSIQYQNFTDFEIILINDFSTDNSSQIIKNLQERDSRIKIVHNKKNMGSLYSRSIGALFANGEYIFPLDNDDMFFSEDIFDSILNIATESDLDIVGFRGIQMSNYNAGIKGMRDLYNYQPNFNLIIKQPQLSTWFLTLNGQFRFHDVTLWCKCIKTKIYKETIVRLGFNRYSKYVSWAEDTSVNIIIFSNLISVNMNIK